MSKLAILLLTLAAACTAEDVAPYDLHIDGAGMLPGANLHVALLEADGTQIITNEWTPVQAAAVALTYGDILAKGVGYQVYIFEDRDNNGLCNFADRIWRTDLAPVQGTMTVDVGTLQQTPDACSYFSSPI